MSEPKDEIKEQLRKKNTDLYIVLIRTFGIISIIIPISLWFIMDLMWDMSMGAMIIVGIILIFISLIWNHFYRKSDIDELVEFNL